MDTVTLGPVVTSGTWHLRSIFVSQELLPSHISLQKDANLKEISTKLAEKEESLEEEFFSLVDYVKDNINKEMNVRTQGNNTEHNRYLDIGKTLTFILCC